MFYSWVRLQSTKFISHSLISHDPEFKNICLRNKGKNFHPEFIQHIFIVSYMLIFLMYCSTLVMFIRSYSQLVKKLILLLKSCVLEVLFKYKKEKLTKININVISDHLCSTNSLLGLPYIVIHL